MRPNNKRSSNAQKRALSTKANEIFLTVDNLNVHFERLGFQPVASIEEAILKILSLWLNIVDFVKGKLKPFGNKYKLINYTVKSRKFFPKEEAKSTGLSQLLIRLAE